MDNTDLVSESNYGDVPLETVIRETMIDLQNALNHVEVHLLKLISHDEITITDYTPIWALSVDLIDLAKELKNIVKSFKPKGFKAKLTSVALEEHLNRTQ